MSFKVGNLIRLKEECVPAHERKIGKEMAVYLIIEYRNGYATRLYNNFINRVEHIEYDGKHKYYIQME